MQKTFKNRVVEVAKSWRFWAVVIVSLVEGFQREGIMDQGTAAIVLNIVQYVAGGAATIRTVDRFSEKVNTRSL